MVAVQFGLGQHIDIVGRGNAMHVIQVRSLLKILENHSMLIDSSHGLLKSFGNLRFRPSKPLCFYFTFAFSPIAGCVL